MLSNVINQRDGLSLRQEILKRLKHQVQLYLGKEPKDLRRYALAYKKNIERSRWKPSSKEELYQTLFKMDLVFGGDFHAFAQAQKVHLRALREITVHKKVILAVECVESKHQKILDQFVAGEITEDVFLSKIKWHKSWGFSWEQYKPLFDIVKKTGGRCLALNLIQKSASGKTLSARDQHASQILRKTHQQKNSDELIYVIYGDLHIAKEHLPRRVTEKMHPAPKYVILYLNPEKIYFQLVRKNLEHKINVVRFSKNEFCLIESPPWVKWQSYLLFLEENIDQALPDDESQLDYGEHVTSLIKLISADLKWKGSYSGDIHSFDDSDFLDRLREKLSAADYQFIEELVGADLSFYYPMQQTAFLSRGTVNHAAHLAALIVHAQIANRKKMIFNLPEQFSILIWVETVAFALSKMINPHRKSLNLNDLKKQLAAFSPHDGGIEALKIALDQKMKDLLLVYGGPEISMEPSIYIVKETISYYKAAKILGGILGENIFLSLRAGRLSRSKWLKWLKQPVEVQDFPDFYVQVLKELDKIGLGETDG